MQTTQNTLTVEKTTKTITIAETKNQKFPLSAPATHGKSTIPALWAKQEPTTDTIAETNHQSTKTPQKTKKSKKKTTKPRSGSAMVPDTRPKNGTTEISNG